jgi:iron complex outermembrane receptor protein
MPRRPTSSGLPLALWTACAGVQAQTVPAPPEVTLLDPVVVSAGRSPESAFRVPAAVSVVDRDTLRHGGAQVNLSESLNRVPGISVLNRQNYAQDLQLSIRGFGARSTFGIRGVRLIVDGIPATMPDGQGQASGMALSSAGRIEVLRGPMAQLYGNAAGGVVQVFTEDEPERPTLTLTGAAGPDHLTKAGIRYSGNTPSYGLTLDASHFRTDGYRDHSAAQRGQFNARLRTEIGQDTKLSVVLNALDQPRSQDPLGLTRAQWANQPPRRVDALAVSQDARKSVRQQQVGTVVEHRISEATHFTGRLYIGSRSLDNALSIPLAPQASPTSSGGMVEFERGYGGLGGQLEHRIALGGGRSLQLTGGIELDQMRENRQGYVNDGGTRGALKRDERNRVENRDAFVQARLGLSPSWTVVGGLRRSEVRFTTRDRFVTPGNPDDSGGVDYHATNPVLGLAWHTTPDLNLYANLGRGFETPTFTELAYRPGGATGLNTGLGASRSRHGELGAKWKVSPSQRLDVALFDIRTRGELVVDTNGGGRSTFKNAGRTERRGLELAHAAQFGPAWKTTLSLTALHARFTEGFTSNGRTVNAGNRLPGTPERSAFAELAWSPARAWGGFNAAAEVVHTGRLVVNDLNDDAAASSTVVNLRAAWSQQVGGWRFTQLLRLENAGDRRHAGSVIVNEANGRYFEPAPQRGWLLAVGAQCPF